MLFLAALSLLRFMLQHVGQNMDDHPQNALGPGRSDPTRPEELTVRAAAEPACDSYSYVSFDFARSTSEAGGVNRSP